MKIIITAFLCIINLCPVYGSWPSAYIDTEQLKSEPGVILKPLLKGHAEIYISSDDFRKPTIEYNSTKKVFSCRFPVAYFESKKWLSLRHVEKTINKWTAKPSVIIKGVSGSCQNAVELVAILDEAKISFCRVSNIRTELRTKVFLAAWNNLEFEVSEGQKDILIYFIQSYLDGFPSGTKIGVYIK